MTERHWLYLGVGLPVLLGALDLTVISAVLPVIIGDLDLVVPNGVRQASWLVIGYLIAYAIGIVGGGRLGDRYGSRRVLVWAVTLFGIASAGLILLDAASVRLVQQVAYRGFEARPDPGVTALAVLTGWRVLQALGAGAVVPAGMAFGWKRLRSRSWLGFVAAVDLLGWTFGHLYGGIVVRFFDWPVAFWLNVPAAVVAIVVLTKIPADPGGTAAFPWGSFVLVSAGLAGLIIGMGGAEGASLPVRPAYLLGGGALLAWGLRIGRHSLLPWADMKANRLALIANVAVGYVVFLLLAAVPIFVAVLVESDSDMAAWTTGWTLTAFTVPLAASALIGGKWAKKSVLAGGLVAATLGLLLLTTWQPNVSAMLPALLLSGIGLGWLFAPLAEAPLRDARDETAGAVSSIIILLRLLGMAAGSSILTSFVLAGIADLDVSSGVTDAVLDVFHDVPWIALPAVLLLVPALTLRTQD